MKRTPLDQVIDTVHDFSQSMLEGIAKAVAASAEPLPKCCNSCALWVHLEERVGLCRSARLQRTPTPPAEMGIATRTGQLYTDKLFLCINYQEEFNGKVSE